MEYKQKEFCRLTGLTRKALLLYEDKGVLTPSRVDAETGYRYYDEANLIRGGRVSFFRSLGFGIDEIATALTEESALRELFRAKEHALWSTYQQMRHALRALYLSASGSFPLDDEPSVEKLSYPQLLTLEGVGTARDVAIHFSLLYRYITTNGIIAAGDPFTWYYADSTDEKLHFKVCLPTDEPWGILDRGFALEPAPAMRVATLRHLGSYELLPLRYERLRSSCREHRWNRRGDYLEIYRTQPLKSTVKDTTTLITDIGAVLC